jgi:Tfp pilus assembly protein PilV
MRRHAAAGSTLVDVLLAMVIVGFICTALMEPLVTSTKLNGRSRHLAAASLIAGNDAEKIRAEALVSPLLLADTSYTVRMDRSTYRLQRTIIENDQESNAYAVGLNQEIEIKVFAPGFDSALVVFRTLQGR